MRYNSPTPDIQIAFLHKLLELKGTHLQQALFNTLNDSDIFSCRF